MIERGNIFLGGGGGIGIGKNVNKSFFSKLNGRSKILYVPIAWKDSKDDYVCCRERFLSLARKYVKTIKASNVMLLTETNVSDINFDNFSAIYIGGGNTFKLLDFCLKNDLITKFKDFANRKGLIFGGSAGAMIFGKDINTCIEERGDYTEHFGFNLISDCSIRCHYRDSKEEGLLKKLSKSIQGNIYALPENSAIMLNKNFKIVGSKGRIFLFAYENGNVNKVVL